MDTASDLPEVAVWDYSRGQWFPHYACPGEKRVRVDYHGNIENLAVFEVKRTADHFYPVNPFGPLADWRIDLS